MGLVGQRGLERGDLGVRRTAVDTVDRRLGLARLGQEDPAGLGDS
jgi:hypothetical protein